MPVGMKKMNDSVNDFYAEFASLYHLVYPDWEQSIERQAFQLESIIRENWGKDVSSVLDATCGIGTQSLGLAKRGFQVTASDISSEAVARAETEAITRELDISFSVADMRELSSQHARQFDVVISCDNSVPHLLTDNDILIAFKEFRKCTRPGGGCVISVRDYEKENPSDKKIRPYGIREKNGIRYLLFQVWDFHGSTYDMSIYLVEDIGEHECRTRVLRTRFYAITIPTLMDLMRQAGFQKVKRLDDKFFQPAIIGTRRA